MNELPALRFGALVRNRTTRCEGHFVRISHTRHCGPAYQVMDTATPGSTSIIYPEDLEVLRAEPTYEDITTTNQALAARAAARCKYKIGDTVLYREINGTLRRLLVTYVVPVFNDYTSDSYKLRCTDLTLPAGNWLEADQCQFWLPEDKA